MKSTDGNLRRFWKVLPILAIPLLPAAACADDGGRFAGLWKGAIVFDKGTVEGDMVAEFEANPDGKLVGRCSLPIHNVVDWPLVDVQANGTKLSFVYKDDTGSSQVDLSLSADGKHLNGSMLEKGKTYPLYLKRTSREELAPKGSLQILSADNRELRQRFDKDAGKVRLLVLLSPTCPTCVRMARMIQRYLLEEVDSSRVAVYLVWAPMLEGDDVEKSRPMLAHTTDARAVHYWSPNDALAKQFSKPLETELPAWDVLFFFGPEARWGETPKFADYSHTWGKKLSMEHQFNGDKLAGQVRRLLTAQAGAK